MRTRTRAVISALAAAAALMLATSAASAGRLELTNAERGFRFVWTPITFEAAGTSVRCNLTLEGSFTRRTTTKTISAFLGLVTRAPLNTCTGGTMTTTRWPWFLVYRGFGGALPNISSLTLDINNGEFSVQPEGLPGCNFSTETGEPMRGIATISSGELTQIRADETATIGTGGGFLCEFGTRGRFIGTGTASVLGETAKTRIRLI